MPLTLSFYPDEDFYIDGEQFFVEEVRLTKGCIVSNEAGEEFEILPDKATPVMPDVKLSEGPRAIANKTRLVFMAPKRINILRGDKHRQNEEEEDAIRSYRSD